MYPSIYIQTNHIDKGPHFICGTSILNEVHYKNIVSCLESMKSSSTKFDKVPHINYEYLLRVVSLISLINMRSNPPAISCFREVVRYKDIYRWGYNLAIVRGLRSVHRQMGFPPSTMVSASALILDIGEPYIYTSSQSPIDYPLILPLALARYTYEENNIRYNRPSKPDRFKLLI